MHEVNCLQLRHQKDHDPKCEDPLGSFLREHSNRRGTNGGCTMSFRKVFFKKLMKK